MFEKYKPSPYIDAMFEIFSGGCRIVLMVNRKSDGNANADDPQQYQCLIAPMNHNCMYTATDEMVLSQLTCEIQCLRNEHPFLFLGRSPTSNVGRWIEAKMVRAFRLGHVSSGIRNALFVAEKIFALGTAEAITINAAAGADFHRFTSSIASVCDIGQVCEMLAAEEITSVVDPCAGTGWTAGWFSLFMQHVKAFDFGNNDWYAWGKLKTHFYPVEEGHDACVASTYSAVDSSWALLLAFPDNPNAKDRVVSAAAIQHYTDRGGRYVITITSDREPGIAMDASGWLRLTTTAAPLYQSSTLPWILFPHVITLWKLNTLKFTHIYI